MKNIKNTFIFSSLLVLAVVFSSFVNQSNQNTICPGPVNANFVRIWGGAYLTLSVTWSRPGLCDVYVDGSLFASQVYAVSNYLVSGSTFYQASWHSITVANNTCESITYAQVPYLNTNDPDDPDPCGECPN